MVGGKVALSFAHFLLIKTVCNLLVLPPLLSETHKNKGQSHEPSNKKNPSKNPATYRRAYQQAGRTPPPVGKRPFEQRVKRRGAFVGGGVEHAGTAWHQTH
jgi:hypothetical protein